MTKNLFLLLMFFSCYFSLEAQLAKGEYLSPSVTPIIKHLPAIELTYQDSGIENIDCIYVINLDARPKKWERTQQAFTAEGLKANRVSAVLGWQLSKKTKNELCGPYPILMRGGEIGCLLSHVSIFKDAYERNFNTVWICEDDIFFNYHSAEVANLITELSHIDPDWDMLYTNNTQTGSHLHPQFFRPHQPLFTPTYEPVSPNLMRIKGRYFTCSIIYSRKGLKKILEYFTHVYLLPPFDLDLHFVPNLRQYSAKENLVTHLPNQPSDTVSYIQN